MLFEDSVLVWAIENFFFNYQLLIFQEIAYTLRQEIFTLWGSTVHSFKTFSQLFANKSLSQY